ncbi:MAG TPA: type II toxin-antitoxin system RelE/ParE family toxin [Pirellulales bacterium]|nr:type II toxin-antitoxin system RelE/ParE family toxin [Pirellulales bacterium]
MSPVVQITPTANGDIDAQAAYLARDRESIAARFYLAVKEAGERIARSPELGAGVPSRGKKVSDLRMCRVPDFRNHLIFYRPIDGGIEIVRVLHGARDWQSLLDL